jgi:sugar phosphate isomerase/epimerase
MYLGIKVGPDNWREKLLTGIDVRHIEIYADFTLDDDYTPLFAWMREQGVQGRLHASTPLPGGVFATLATADRQIRQASNDLIRHTLDVAGENGMRAIVVHPGSYRVPRIRNSRVEIVGPDTAPGEGDRWLMHEVLRLAAYGRDRGVELLIENMPGREFAGYDPIDRAEGVDVRFVPYSRLRALGEAGVALCIDLAHLYTELMVDGTGAKDGLHGRENGLHGRENSLHGRENGLYGRVMSATAELAPYAKHVHLSTVAPPWNGTDGHSGFTEQDYAQGAIPGREQLVSWLRLFAGRDLWVIPEPSGGADAHLANYRVLSEWMEGIV